MAAHIVLEESGEKYEPIRIDLTKGEQRSLHDDLPSAFWSGLSNHHSTA
jgi:hypothetical protein